MPALNRRRFVRAAGSLALMALVLGGAAARAATAGYAVGPARDISARCRAQNAEVESAADPAGRYVYETWIGCQGIGFARSTDGGLHFSKAVRLARSGPNAWDPALAVAPDGTVYASFMVMEGTRSVPVVLASFNHGRRFPQQTVLRSRRKNNWGDRDFIAAGPNNAVYLTWDYGPSDAAVKLHCPAAGSCGFTHGDLNIVVQVSTDGGKRFDSMIRLSPGFPAGGAASAPLVVEPSGRIDVLYQRYRVIRRKTYALGRGLSYFSSSTDEGRSWSKPVKVGGSVGTLSPTEWWIDGAISIDAGGNIYATWDTQGRHRDTGWLAYSADHGVTWSAPVRVTPDGTRALHMVQSAGGPVGIAYVGWLTDRPRRGYAEYLRTFSIARGWLSGPKEISRRFGSPGVWPGDTFGISTLSSTDLLLSWGSATPLTRRKSEIFAARVAVTLR